MFILIYRHTIDLVCVLILYLVTWLNSLPSYRSFFVAFWDFLHRQSYHLQVRVFLFLSFWSMCLLFSFLTLLLWLEPLKQAKHRLARVSILTLFPILGRKHLIIHHCVICSYYYYYYLQMFFIKWRTFLSIPSFHRIIS